MIKIENLNFGYFDTEVLKGLSIEVREGEILALLGPNGSGKTTLLKILSKILEPKGGTVLIFGKDIRHYSYNELAKTVSMVPQIHRANQPYTVFDVVLMGRNPQMDSMFPRESDKRIALSILEELGILHLRDRPYTDISGGELRLVLIARALAQESKIMLLDEPTAFLDFKNASVVLQKIVELKEKRGKTIIVTLHDPNEALSVADRILLMKRGEIVQIGTPEEVLSEKNLKYVYGIDVEKISINGKTFIYAK
ncbi:ABC transporter ATP-binding protein [Caldisericum exile]|uniref:ABC transporter ATP-binding protein n=1 Tax=Caldisericum exile (strain DSM 21853 / NBRC 104410 / AZM16c01) TaxID=511051 RepID=A0A7U6GD10_CALEA|nr:ABC transporter ATP-binding protein [Caldisericum exile]BAL80162.1 ABC transporter ATP-binding protein [Caldisericum exile AZM16c01]